ncbi:MAG: hypothetical protein U0989_17445 [Azonexus sp.]|nr:hypothetical protein [Azonexus sp.]MDZ4316540.1 hypothetical protein [Azonexus sp.]
MKFVLKRSCFLLALQLVSAFPVLAADTLDDLCLEDLTKPELAITGRNLIGANRTEFISDYIPSVPVEIVPSVLLSARWKF